MAWKLKKSQTSAGTEAPVAPVDGGTAAQFDRAAVGHDDAHTDRSVMVLGDDDYLNGLMPSGGSVDPAHGSAGAGGQDSSNLFPAASDDDLDRYLRGDSSFAAPAPAPDSVANGAIELDSPTAADDYDDEAPHRQAIELDDSLLGAAPAPQMASAVDPAGDELEPLPVSPSSNRTVMYIDNLPDGSTPARPAMDLDDHPVARPAMDLDDEPTAARPAMDLDETPVGLGDVPTSNPFMAPPVVQAPAAPAAPTMAAATPAAPEPDYLSSAINESDEAVASLRSATQDRPAPPPAAAAPAAAAPAAPAAAAGMENWDLDAFAPYQPPGGGGAARPAVEAAAPAPASSTPPVEESLVGAVSASRLIVRLGQFSASYELTKAETTVGRPDPRTKVFPDVAVEWDDAVSRNHCHILHRSDGDYLEDTGSTNGTKLNDKMIPPYVAQLLSDGDRIGVGEKTEITYIK